MEGGAPADPGLPALPGSAAAGGLDSGPQGRLTGSREGAQRSSHFLSVYYIPDTVLGSHLILTTAL